MNYEFDLLQYDHTICSSSWGVNNENAIFYRMYYIFGGEAYVEIAGIRTYLQKDWFYILPLMSSYTLVHEKENPLEVLWFHVEMKQEYYRELKCIHIESHQAISHLLHAMKHLMQSNKYHQMICNLFDEFLYLQNEEEGFCVIKSRRMRQIVLYVEQNLGKDIGVSTMAQQVGMERSYFSRKFKEIFKMSPNKYLYAKRMCEAAKLLLQDVSVIKVAEKVGYGDEKAFSRAFKKYMDISPSQYKKSHIEQP